MPGGGRRRAPGRGAPRWAPPPRPLACRASRIPSKPGRNDSCVPKKCARHYQKQRSPPTRKGCAQGCTQKAAASKKWRSMHAGGLLSPGPLPPKRGKGSDVEGTLQQQVECLAPARRCASLSEALVRWHLNLMLYDSASQGSKAQPAHALVLEPVLMDALGKVAAQHAAVHGARRPAQQHRPAVNLSTCVQARW